MGDKEMKKGFGQMMKQAQKMQAQLNKIQEEVGEKTVEASAGGGMVTVTANGKQQILSIRLEPEVVDPEDVDQVADAVLALCNNEQLRKDLSEKAWTRARDFSWQRAAESTIKVFENILSRSGRA